MKDFSDMMKRALGLLAAVACFCGGKVFGQETVEIRFTNRDGVSHTVEVNREEIRQLDFVGAGILSITLPEGLINLVSLNLSANRLTRIALPKGLANLRDLTLRKNLLTSLTLPEGLTNLSWLSLADNPLTSLTLAEDTAKVFSGIITEKGLAYNLLVSCKDVPLKKVILPKRLDEKAIFSSIPDDVYNNLEFLFLEDLRMPKITRAGDTLEIIWEIGVLQTSASIEGPWKDVRASSPLRIFPRPSLSSEFFRLRAE